MTETPPADEVPPEPEVKYAQVTEAQLAALLDKATAFDSHQANTKKELDRAFGTIGNMKQVIDRLQSGTQAGNQVELTEEDIREISDQYPDLGKSMLKTLQNVVGKLKGTGSAAPFDVSSIDQRVQQQIAPQMEDLSVKIMQKIAHDDLIEDFPTYREIAGPPGSNTEFRQWLAKQPNNREAKVLESNRTAVIHKALTDFVNSKKAAPKQGNRENRLRSAITPRGEASHTASVTDDDDFDKGFKSVKKY